MDFFDHTQLSPDQFENKALELFRFQAEEVPVYKRFIRNLEVNPMKVSRIEEIPFLPIEFFKTEKVYCHPSTPERCFLSSSTTNTGQSYHYISSVETYKRTFGAAFNQFYGAPKNYCFLFLLPSYLEREGSSLVFMAQEFVSLSSYKQSGFYLYNHQQLYEQLLINEKKNIPTILFGVSFALLDFAERYPIKLNHTIVMETGGMKGRRVELHRSQLHFILKRAFGVETIHSEYGMTELLSQAYSSGNGIFRSPAWMRALVYNPYNPLRTINSGAGGINIIDLANQHSCAFIQTSDVGKVFPDGSFSIDGRSDYSEVRGCNLMVATI